MILTEQLIEAWRRYQYGDMGEVVMHAGVGVYEAVDALRTLPMQPPHLGVRDLAVYWDREATYDHWRMVDPTGQVVTWGGGVK